MAFGTISTLFAPAEPAEGSADRGGRVDSYVGISAFIIRAVSAQKMQTRWDIVGRVLMRQITGFAQRAAPFAQVVLADGNLLRIMDIATVRPLGALTCGKRLAIDRVRRTGCRQIGLFANDHRAEGKWATG